MSVKIKLFTTDKLRKKGYPIVIDIYSPPKRKRIATGFFSFPEHWDTNKQIPLPEHPDYDLIYTEIIPIKEKIKYINYKKITDIDEILTLLGEKSTPKSLNFSQFGNQLIGEQIKIGKKANAKVYQNAILQYEKYLKRKIHFADINYTSLSRWKNHLLQSVSKNTVHNYLSTLRAIYNEADKRHIVQDTRPFRGIFKGLTVRNAAQKKKYITKKDIKKLEEVELTGTIDFARDLFLMQFYLGGQDLIDIYHLKKEQINNERIYIQRKKLAGKGYQFDLKIFPKIQDLIDKYENETEYIFPGRKDYDGYNTFRRRYQRYLIKLQKQLQIDL